MEARFEKITTLGTPAGTTITPTKMEQADQASAMTAVLGNLTAEPTTYSGAGFFWGDYGWASLAGYQYAPVPEERGVFGPSSNWGLRLMTTGTSSTYLSEATWREIG